MVRHQRSWVVAGVLALAAVAVLALAVVTSLGRPEPVSAPPRSTATSTGTTPAPTVTRAPGAPAPVCGSPGLAGPPRPPQGAVVVSTSDHLGRLTDDSPPGTTFWLEPGRHVLGDGEFDQVAPKAGNRYVGAPGAVLDGRRRNRYAFTEQATGVRIEYLTIERFGPRGGNPCP